MAIPLDNVRTDGPGAELLKGVIQFEENEIRHARDKKKILEMDVVHFVRKVVKHFVTSSQRYLQLLISAADGSKIPVLVVLMEWHADAGPFYGMGGAYIEKLDAFPVDIETS